MQKLSKILFLLVLASPIFAQSAGSRPTVWVTPFEAPNDPKAAADLALYRGQVVALLLKNGAVSVVERDAQKFIEAERELQKTEAFMDGKIVEQGKAVGAQFVLSGQFATADGLLHLKILDVEKGASVHSEVCDLSKNLKWGDDNLATSPAWKKIRKAVSSLLNKWLAKEKVSVVRILEEKKDEARLLLVAGGSAKGFKKGGRVDVFYIAEEVVDEEKYERFVQVGEGKIDLVENANFSQIKLTDGEREVKKLMSESQKLYCKLSDQN